jgi:hypothetical protein
VVVDEVTDIQGSQNSVMNHMPNGSGKRAMLRTVPDELRSVLQGTEILPVFKNLKISHCQVVTGLLSRSENTHLMLLG